MSIWAFPLSAFALTLLVLIPGLTWGCVQVLRRQRARTDAWGDFGGAGTFTLLIAPTVLPLTWLFSSALHQAESTWAGDCLVAHGHASGCSEALVILASIAAVLIALAAQELWTARRDIGTLVPLSRDHAATIRVNTMLARDKRLRHLRVRVVRTAPEPLMTAGWLRPTVVVDGCFAMDTDDAALHAALLHEAAHVSDRDPLRVALVNVALALNPARRMLAPDFKRWRDAREAQCDSHAVHAGGEALALAQGILQAARFKCAGPNVCGVRRLHGDEASTLKLRVALLLDGPAMPARSIGYAVLAGALLFVLAAPHFGPTAALDQFHTTVEQWLHVVH